MSNKKVYVLLRKIRFCAIDLVYYDEIVDIFDDYTRASIFRDAYLNEIEKDSYKLEKASGDRTIVGYTIEERTINV